MSRPKKSIRTPIPRRATPFTMPDTPELPHAPGGDDPSAVPPHNPGAPASEGSPTTSAKPREGRLSNGMIAGGVLLVPLLGVLVARGTDSEEATIAISLGLAPLLALVGGVTLGIRLGRSVVGKALLAVGLTLAFLVGTETLLVAGCTWGR